jgi:hypothetical protein
MSSKLAKSLDSLRAVVPALNAATDEANRLVKVVERVLVNELGIGISATGGRVREFRRHADEELREYLAFGRVNDSFCIYIAEDTYRRDGSGDFSEQVDSQKTPWSSCDRETRLRTFEDLPELIDGIVSEAQRLAEIGSKTAAKVKELIGDSNETNPATENKATAKRKAETVGEAIREVMRKAKDLQSMGPSAELVEMMRKAKDLQSMTGFIGGNFAEIAKKVREVQRLQAGLIGGNFAETAKMINAKK